MIFNPVIGGGGGSTPALGSKTITSNGTYLASADNLDGYDEVTANVPNTYAAGDEGKVVSNGALVAQSSENITQNGTYDTTLKNQVVVNVAGGGGATLITKAITANGTYNASADNADGYSQVTVNVSGGSLPSGTTPPTGGSDGDMYLQQFAGGELTSDGACYIDTGIKPSGQHRAVMEFKLTQQSTLYDTVFGTKSGSAGRFTARFGKATTGALQYQKSTTPSGNYASYNSAITKATAANAYQRIEQGFAVRESGVPKYAYGLGNATAFSYNLFVFANNNAGSPGDYAYASIKYFQLYNANDELVLFLVPAENNGAACMYDLVSGQYYTKQGSGAFAYTGGATTDALLWKKVSGTWKIQGVLL